MIWLLASVSAVLLFYYFLIKPQLHWTARNVKQGFPIPLLGDNYLFILRKKSMFDLFIDLYSQFPNARYRGIYQTTIPTLMVRDPELIKQIAIKDCDHFLGHRTFTNKADDPIWARNLLLLRGDEWRNMRSILSPTFTSSKMKAMFSLMNQSCEQYIKYYLDQKQPVVEVEMKDSLSRLAVDVIANCAFGVNNDSLNHPENDFFINAINAFNPGSLKGVLNMFAPKLFEMLNIGRFDKDIGNFFKKIVYDGIEYREKNHVVRSDVMHLLLEAKKGRLKYEEVENHSKSTGFATVEESDVGKKQNSKLPELTNTDIVAQMVIFFIAGFGTISTSMAFTAAVLAQNPDIQEKLRQEIDEHSKLINGKLNYDALSKMKYLDMVISESLRKYPAFVVGERICTKDYVIDPVLPDETTLRLKEGDSLMFPIAAIHYDPNYYPNPERFDPERFSDENKSNIYPYTYIPFGIGPRNCIGSRFALMEMKTMFFHLLSKFEIVVIKKTTVPIKLSKKSFFSPEMEGGFWVGLKKRSEVTTS